MKTGPFRSLSEKKSEGDDDRPQFETGLKTRLDNGRPLVFEVLRGSAAETAGVNEGEEILVVNEHRVRADQWPLRLDSYQAGQKVTLLVSRRELLKEVEMKLTPAPRQSWLLEVLPDASEDQKAQLRAWLQEE